MVSLATLQVSATFLDNSLEICGIFRADFGSLVNFGLVVVSSKNLFRVCNSRLYSSSTILELKQGWRA